MGIDVLDYSIHYYANANDVHEVFYDVFRMYSNLCDAHCVIEYRLEVYLLCLPAVLSVLILSTLELYTSICCINRKAWSMEGLRL